MTRFKKVMSVAMAVVTFASITLKPAMATSETEMTALQSIQEETEEATAPVENPEVEMQTEDAGEKEDISKETEETEETAASTEIGESKVAEGTETEQQGENDPERTAVKIDSKEKTESGPEEEMETETNSEEDEVILDEVKVHLVLEDYSEEKIKQFPIAELVKNLQDDNKTTVKIAGDAEFVWMYIKGENGTVIREEKHALAFDDKVDLSEFEGETEYHLEWIVGKEQPLTEGNVRYLIKDVNISYPEAEEEMTEDMMELMSMLQLEEVKAYLPLMGYSQNDLEEFPINDLFRLLQDENGNSLQIDATATDAWRYETGDSNGVEEYKKYSITNNDSLDIYPGEGVDEFQLELIIGSGGQLNSDNKRYIIKAYLVETFEDNMGIEIFLQYSDMSREKAEPDEYNEWTYINTYGQVEYNYDFLYREELASKAESVWINVNSTLANNPRARIEIYVATKFLGSVIGYDNEVTDQILNMDMNKVGNGYQYSGKVNDGEKFLVKTYIDDKLYEEKYFVVRTWNGYPYYEGKMFVKEDGERVNAYSSMENIYDRGEKITTLTFELNKEFSASDKYYFDLDYTHHHMVFSKPVNRDYMIEKVVLGHYSSLEEAEDAGCILRSLADSDAFQSGRYAEHNGRSKTLDFIL